MRLCPTASEARLLVFSAAEPVQPGDRVKEQRRRSAERLGMLDGGALERRHRASWYGEAGGFGDDLMRDLRARYQRWRSAQEGKTNDVKRRMADEYEALADRLERTDPALFGEDVRVLRAKASDLRGVAPL
jgi:hypothetical protein